jgi:hypothetical protein
MRIESTKPNAAQQIHEYLGLPVSVGHKQAHGDKNASATKAGPGRYHEDGATRNSPGKSKGAPKGFVQHTNPEKAQRRALIAIHGRRKFLQMLKEHRAMSKATNDERTDAASTRHYESIELA